MTRCLEPRQWRSTRRGVASCELLQSAERIVLRDHPLIPLYFYVNKHLVKPEVDGWYDNVMDVVYSKHLALRGKPR